MCSHEQLAGLAEPGADPVDALQSALLRVAVGPQASLRGQLREGGGLLRAIRRVLPDDDTRLLIVVDQLEELFTMNDDEEQARFLSMVTHMDHQIGRILARLEALGIADQTLVVFASDNGGTKSSRNAPLRGHKGSTFEGGIRVPLIVHWPGQIQPNSTSPAIVTGTDYYPTLLEMLNLPALPDQHIDGRSFVPALKAEDYDRGPIYWHFPHYSNHGFQSPGGAVRSGRYKLLEYYENRTVQLFDLRNDIGEQNDLAESKPNIARKLN